MIGRTLGSFEIVDKLGEGGMGEVYRARDTKLDREVALKVLPREMSGDPERIARFQREARTLATLQHPNVASVYGFEELPEARFLVMELVEGEDLSERLKGGALPIEETVSIARQITEGLEAAHEKGIVHRDLKPANIKVDRDGAVKILDFGLARAYTGDPEEEDLANSPTITAAMTQAGTILGTAAYMSPEQAKGKTVDKRADIWAFGAIIYEMLTGRRLFEAETISETLAGVLVREVEWERLPSDTPPSLRALLERCLQKEPKLRLRDVGEARIVLADPTATAAMQVATGGVVSTTSPRRTWPWLVAVVLALVLGVFGGRTLTTAPPVEEMPSLRFHVADPTDQMLVGSIALSPNGQHIVFALRDTLGGRDLYIRRLDEDEARILPGSKGGKFPFWSADSRHIGFFSGQSLYRTSLDGSAASQVTSLSDQPLGGAWNADDVILIGQHDGPILRIGANGGALEAITEVDLEYEETHCWPHFLPDGQHFVHLSDASTDEGHRLHLRSLDGSEARILLRSIRSAILVDPRGALIWSDNGQLFARPFDMDRRQFTGERALVEDGVNPFSQRHELPVSLSTNGILATQSGSDESVIARVSLADGSREVLLPEGRYRNPRLSPDGSLVAFEEQYSSQERVIWVQDLARGTRTRISERGALSDSPVWGPNGEVLYFGSSVDGGWSVRRKRIFGGEAAADLGRPETTNDIGVLDLSSDGEWLVTSVNPGLGWDLWLGRVDGDSVEWSSWYSNSSNSNQARFSPDTRWLVYDSSTSGQPEVYVSPREGGPDQWQLLVSVGGGSDPAWSPDGNAIYYRDPAGILKRVAVRYEGDQIRLAAPESFYELSPPSVGYLRNTYDPDPDGASVVAFLATGGRTPSIQLRTGWTPR